MNQINPMTPMIEDNIAMYLNMSMDPNLPDIREMKALDKERMILKDKTIQQIENGLYLQIMKQMAEKYPNKQEMNEVFKEFCDQLKITGKTENVKEYEIVANKLLNCVNNCSLSSLFANYLLIDIENEKGKIKGYDEILSSREFEFMPTALMILQYQQLFKKYGMNEIDYSLKRLENTRPTCEEVVKTLRELSTNWRVELTRNKIQVKLFEGINDILIDLFYSKQLKQIIPQMPQMVYGYLEMNIMDLNQYKIHRNQKISKQVMKYLTAYENTHFNLHLLRNNYINRKVFDYFASANQVDIIDRSTSSVSILLGTQNPFVLQVKIVPIQYKFTVAKQSVKYSHFDVYEKQPFEYILTAQQIIQQERNEYEERLKENEREKDFDIYGYNKQKEMERKEKEIQEQREKVVHHTYEYMLMKRKKTEVNKLLHEFSMAFMKTNKQYLMLVKWKPHESEKNKILFSLVVYDNNDYEEDEMVEPLRKFTGSISNGNEFEFEGRNFTYLVFSEVMFILDKIVKSELKKLSEY